MKHKLLSILLCLAMALSLLPTAALADEATGTGTIKVGEKTYSSFSDAVNGATPDENGVITYEISGKVDVSVTTSNAWGMFSLLKDDSASNESVKTIKLVKGSENAEICIKDDKTIIGLSNASVNVVYKGLKLSRTAGKYSVDAAHGTCYFTTWLRAGGELTYTNCTFPNGTYNNQYGTTEYTQCKFSNQNESAAKDAGVGDYNLWTSSNGAGGNGVVKVSNCTFEGVRGVKLYSTNGTAGSLKLSETNFTNLTEKAAIVVSTPATVEMNAVTATGCSNGLLQKKLANQSAGTAEIVIPSGSNVSGAFDLKAEDNVAGTEFNITAGTFPGGINNDYLAPGANFDATTGEVKMSYVAKIVDTEYPTLADAFAAANKTGDTVIELLDDINMTGKNWTPVKVDGYNGQGVITLNGNGKTITGLKAPLFAGGFGGTSGIVINNLTLENVNLNDTGSEYAGTGFGAFICAVDSMPTISLTNCHVKGGTIESTSGARVGGLIGWTSGYNNPNNGPVDTKVTLTDCSVENVTIEANGSVGGLIGHAGANPTTYHNITDCTVSGCTLTSTKDSGNYVGTLVGTANVGQITVDAASSASGNTLKQNSSASEEASDKIVGREAVNNTGLVIVDNKVVAAGTAYGDIVNKKANEVLVEVSKGRWVKPNADMVAMIGATEYLSLPDAITAAKDGDTIKLLKDVTVTKPIEVTKSMTLDLNGHVLTAATVSTATVKNSAIWVTAEKVNLTIDGTTAGSGMTMGDTHDTNWEAKVWGFVDLREGSAGSTVTVNGGSYTGSTCASDSYHYTALFTVGSESKLVLNNVSAETDERVVKASSCGEVVVSGGTYNITGINAFLGAAFETKTASFTDMKLTAKYGGCVQVGRNATLENCEIKVTDIRTGDGTYLNCAVAVQYGGTATVKSGIYTAPYAAYVYSSGGTINIENGTFTGVVRADATTDTTAVINIKNGSFNGEIQKGGGPGSETISITGGTFSFDPSTKVKNNGTDYIVKRAGSEGAYTYTVLAKSGLTSGVYLTNPSGALASNYYVSSTANGVWTVSYSAPYSGGSSSYDPTYSVSTPSKTKNGSVTVSPKSASKGDTVTVTVKPGSGYVLETLTVTDKNGNELTLKDKGNGKYTFTMPAGKVEVKATFMEDNSMLNFFYDVPNNAYFYEAVKWAVKNGITTGVGNDLFAPEQPCTRAQIVTFLWRAAGSPEPKGTAAGMTDVVSGSYYAKAVAWAIENGVTTGTTATTFSPDATCTRAQAVTFLARALNAKAASAAEFSDVPTDSYFVDAVAWAAANGVTEGIGGGLFAPDNDCTRGQIVTFLYRAYNK